jgi:hypothetical protein
VICGSGPPFDVRQSLFVGHYASTEMRCFWRLEWPFPAFVLDTYIEHRRLTNGRFLPPSRNPGSSPRSIITVSNRSSRGGATVVRGTVFRYGSELVLLLADPSPVESEVGDGRERRA